MVFFLVLFKSLPVLPHTQTECTYFDKMFFAFSRLSVLLEYHQAFTLPQGILLSLLETVAKYGQPQTAGTSPEGGGPSDLMAGLFRNLRELLDQSLEVLSNHLVTIDPASSGGLETLKSHLLWVTSRPCCLNSFTFAPVQICQEAVFI